MNLLKVYQSNKYGAPKNYTTEVKQTSFEPILKFL